MPASTVNRLYPYSIPGDPNDVPQALQDLVEAIDDDVCTLLQTGGRPASRFRGTGTYNSPAASGIGGDTTNRVPFDTIDFNNANVTMQTMVTGNRLLFPEDPGFYVGIATVQVPTLTTVVTSVDYIGLQIRRGNISSPAVLATRLAGGGNHIPANADDRNVRVIAVATGGFFNGTTDAFSIEFRAMTTPTIADYPIRERTLTILKMTQS